MEIRARLEAIRHRIDEACRRSGRDPKTVRCVAVSKTRTVDEIREAVSFGVTDLGENRVQEAESKHGAIAPSVRWHLVGHLQANKARKAVQIFDVIHSLDGIDLARRLDRFARELGKVQPVLIQVDLASEETKFGLPSSELFTSLEELESCSSLRIEGLMLLPPYLPDPEDVRPFFRRLRGLSEEARKRGLGIGAELSMGMSHDFETAIEEGATWVRLGTALFGERPAPVAAAEAREP
jgi:pyridoxal phosphate enzyme (YggS family)